MSYTDKVNGKLKSLEQKDDILILAIETSCDDTSVAVLKNGRNVLSNKIASQISLHNQYGGVVPEIASRKHVEAINPVIAEAIKESKVELKDIDAIAVTYGPGLVGALLVGVSTAKALAYGLSLPLIGVHHIEGHISANYIAHTELEPPFISLVVSGGHSHVILVKDYGSYEVIGRTRDDAAGEAYDKVARALNLGYPGGPVIDKLAQNGDAEAIKFPRSHLDGNPYDFSFSGLKTAVINYLHTLDQRGGSYNIHDIAASFQQAIIEVLVENTVKAAKDYGVHKIALAGGVAANSGLRMLMKDKADKNNLDLFYPPVILCTDNAAMIGCAAYYNLLRRKIKDLSLNADPNLPLGC